MSVERGASHSTELLPQSWMIVLEQGLSRASENLSMRLEMGGFKFTY